MICILIIQKQHENSNNFRECKKWHEATHAALKHSASSWAPFGQVKLTGQRQEKTLLCFALSHSTQQRLDASCCYKRATLLEYSCFWWEWLTQCCQSSWIHFKKLWKKTKEESAAAAAAAAAPPTTLGEWRRCDTFGRQMLEFSGVALRFDWSNMFL